MKKEKVKKFIKLQGEFLPLYTEMCETLYTMICDITNGKIDYVISIDYDEEYNKFNVKYSYEVCGENEYEDIRIPCDWLSNPDWIKEYMKDVMHEEQERINKEKIKQEEEKAEFILYLELKAKFENKGGNS